MSMFGGRSVSPINQELSLETAKQNLPSLQAILLSELGSKDGAQIYEFAKYFVSKMRSSIDASFFHLQTALVLADFRSGRDGFDRKPLQSPAVGLPESQYTLMYCCAPIVARTLGGDRFGDAVREVFMQNDAEYREFNAKERGLIKSYAEVIDRNPSRLALAIARTATNGDREFTLSELVMAARIIDHGAPESFKTTLTGESARKLKEESVRLLKWEASRDARESDSTDPAVSQTRYDKLSLISADSLKRGRTNTPSTDQIMEVRANIGGLVKHLLRADELDMCAAIYYACSADEQSMIMQGFNNSRPGPTSGILLYREAKIALGRNPLNQQVVAFLTNHVDPIWADSAINQISAPPRIGEKIQISVKFPDGEKIITTAELVSFWQNGGVFASSWSFSAKGRPFLLTANYDQTNGVESSTSKLLVAEGSLVGTKTVRADTPVIDILLPS